jgi:hypothetical protein
LFQQVKRHGKGFDAVNRGHHAHSAFGVLDDLVALAIILIVAVLAIPLFGG